MTNTDEKNLTATLNNLVTSVATQTGDSRWYIARIAETILEGIRAQESLPKPRGRMVGLGNPEQPPEFVADPETTDEQNGNE